MKKKIIIISILIILSLGSYLFLKPEELTLIQQSITKVNTSLSIKYNPDRWSIRQGEGTYSLGYTAGFTLYFLEDEDIYLSFGYDLQNNGDDTPKSVGDTGAGLFPPQPEELKHEFNPERHTYIGTYLGKELFVTPYRKTGYATVVQKLNDGRVAGLMPLLSEDQDRVSYYDNFSINADLKTDDPKQQERVFKDFERILKSLKIEKINEQKPE